MKTYFFCWALCLLILPAASCRKGKKMPTTIYVTFESPSTAGIYPTACFDPIDPFDFNEPTLCPNYVSEDIKVPAMEHFNNELKSFLENNNVELSALPQEYKLVVDYLSLSESVNRQSYTDTCAFIDKEKYVYYHKIECCVRAFLYKNNVLLDSWTMSASASERVRSKTDDCNEPKIGKPYCGFNCLIRKVAKKLRVKISKKIFSVEEF